MDARNDLKLRQEAAVVLSDPSELIKAALLRLEKALDQENKALTAFEARNLGEFSRIKRQSLLELERSGTMLSPEHTSPELLEILPGLRQKLELNRWLLLLHLEAAREVTGVIASAIREAESDGTYSRICGTAKVQG